MKHSNFINGLVFAAGILAGVSVCRTLDNQYSKYLANKIGHEYSTKGYVAEKHGTRLYVYKGVKEMGTLNVNFFNRDFEPTSQSDTEFRKIAKSFGYHEKTKKPPRRVPKFIIGYKP